MKTKFRFREHHYLERASGWLHVIGAFVTLFGIFVLDYYSGKKDDLTVYYSTAAFMSSMLLVYIASAVYHIIPHNKEWKQVFRRIDQSAIYLLIAGTYTPLFAIALRNDGGMQLLIVIWITAIIGATLKLLKLNLSSNLQTVIYIIMGAVWAPLAGTLVEALGLFGSCWFFGGVVAYLVGAAFYLYEERYDPENKGWNHEIFHIFVMIGCFCHYWLIKEYLLRL